MPSNGSSSAPPFTTAGMSFALYGPMVSLWIVICAFCIGPFAVFVGMIEAQRADTQPSGGFFRETMT